MNSDDRYRGDLIPQIISGAGIFSTTDEPDTGKEEDQAEGAIDNDLFDIVGVIVAV